VQDVTDPDPDPLLQATGLTKTFGDFTAVDGIDFAVQRGESFGFLGPNGAGKSSTMKMVGCVSPASSGVLRVFGQDPATHGPQIRARLGVVPQKDTLDEELTVQENLWIYGRYFGLSRSEVRSRATELLDFAQLTDRARSKVEPLSGGMKRRLTIARSLISRPEILLLDEPTTGLDPQARHVLWDRLIVAEGSPRSLITQYSTREVLELRFDTDDHGHHGDAIAGIGERVEVLPDRLLVYAEDGDAAAAAVHMRGIEPLSSLVRRSTLEDVFLHLTGRQLVD